MPLTHCSPCSRVRPQSIAETVLDWNLPFLDPRPRHEVGPAAIPLLRLCILELDLSLMVLDRSTTQQLTPQARKDLKVRPVGLEDLKVRGNGRCSSFTALHKDIRDWSRPNLFAKVGFAYSGLCCLMLHAVIGRRRG